ncbi:hypothetical protein [Dictyobacter kobayashii]|uniref:Uncharacterized protein n=1 Tax=Dictyobacter kobayashii TaxID=2014872 RepID=A0A402AF17_9CHLR|nr:hypothetical protein [Dictyobacter kobayashii]GCE17689.1 hypothetical protein KDK_14890 [Dictyobacter kobayashii]
MIATSVPEFETRHITKKQFAFGTIIARWPLLVILAFQAIISLVTLHNTAFQDEALYLYAGQQIFNHWMGVLLFWTPMPLTSQAIPTSIQSLAVSLIGSVG